MCVIEKADLSDNFDCKITDLRDQGYGNTHNISINLFFDFSTDLYHDRNFSISSAHNDSLRNLHDTLPMYRYP